MTLLHLISLTLLFFQQQLPPLMQAQEKPPWQQTLELIGSIATPLGVLLIFVNLAYFWWHSRNREELTKALAEATSLADTRGKRIADLVQEKAEAEINLGKRDAVILEKLRTIADMELDDERRAKTEFRLRAEIADLERQLGISQHHSKG